MIQAIKQNKKAVLAFLLALVMLIGLIPFTATEAHAMTVDATGENVVWEAGDSFTLYLVNKDDPTKTETHTVTYDGTKWSTFKSAILPAYAFAHIGEVEDIAYKDGKWNYTPVLKSGYNVLSDLADADVMVATSEVAAGTDLSLKFKHCFSKVSFHCWPNTEFEGNTDITGIRVSDSHVIAYHEADAFEAIIAPRAYAEGEFFATVTVNSGNGVSMELTVKVPEGGLTFEAGKHYTFNITVGKDKVEIDTITVNGDFPGGWENEVNLNADADVTVGTPDQGKTQWEKGDLLAFDFTSDKYGDFLCGVKYENNAWSSTIYPIGKIMTYLENETPTVNAIYSPHYTLNEMGDVNAGSPNNSGGNSKGKYEFIEIGCTLSGETITADFTNATRNYSRLRIVGLPNQTLTVTTMDFTPAGATESGEYTYNLTTDDNGNAFLYGTFAAGATVNVKQGEVTLKDYTFTESTANGISYALDAMPVIDGTLGGKTTATWDDVNALVDQLKAYVDSGITTIIVTGSNPAMITVNNVSMTAIGEAIYRLSGSGTHSADNQYNGKIDLILPDVTEIVGYEFQNAYALNSITLPKVTTVGEHAFDNCLYLQKLTFGSVVTLIKDNLAFNYVGKYADGGYCDLVLNREQVNAETEYQPNPLTNQWWNYTLWKSITLI